MPYVLKRLCHECRNEIPPKNWRGKSKFCNDPCYRTWQKKHPNKGTFRKGHIPPNKGNKGIHVSPNTEFKKGNRPPNSKPVGTITVRTEKNGQRRRRIKVAEPNKWLMYALYIWQSAGLTLRKDQILHYRNGNSLDDRIENLEPVTRVEHIELHRKDLILARIRSPEDATQGYIKPNTKYNLFIQQRLAKSRSLGEDCDRT